MLRSVASKTRRHSVSEIDLTSTTIRR